MNPTRHVVRRILAHRIAIYVMIGVAWTYAITAIVVLLLPIPTLSYGGRATIHRAEFDSSRPFLRLRVWQSPHGSYFQIHRTRALNAQTMTWYYDVESLTENCSNRSLFESTVGESK